MNKRKRIADLFCGAGGAGMGLHRAGFRVVGFDINPQPNYPFEFHQADALSVDLSGFDAVWASPPCQAHTTARHIHQEITYVDLIPETRKILNESGKPWIMENVVGAPLITNVVLCGEMFGLKVFRHRLFESSVMLLQPFHATHPAMAVTNTGPGSKGQSSFRNGATHISVVGQNFSRTDAEIAMDIDWMKTRSELSQAIPPAYSEFLGQQLMTYIARVA